MPRKILLVFLGLAAIFSTALTPIARAEGEWYDQSFQEWHEKVFDTGNSDEIFGERYTRAQVQWIIYSLFSFTINALGQPPEATNCYLNNDLRDCVSYVVTFINSVTDFHNEMQTDTDTTAFIFDDRPLSLITDIKNFVKDPHIISSTQAQGFGFDGLDPVRTMWTASRDIAYVLFTLIIIIMAFMIMFRVKINPQTVVTVQSALPKIVIALILVTFSYAIAGLLVDLMYLVIGLLSVGLAQFPGTVDNAKIVFNTMVRGPANFGVFGFMIRYITFFSGILIFVIFAGGGLFPTLILGAATAPLAIILGVLTFVLLFVVFIFQFFKVSFLLIKTFANVLVLTIIAPFQITLGAVAQGMGFGLWVRSYLSNLAVFPTVGVLFTFAYIFVLQAAVVVFNNLLSPITDLLSGAGIDILEVIHSFGVPAPVTSAGWPPILGSSGTLLGLIYLGVSYTMMVTAPKAADLIKSIIKGQEFAYGSAIGEAFGPVKAVGLWGAAEGLNVAEDRYKTKHGAAAATPAEIQVARRLLGLKS